MAEVEPSAGNEEMVEAQTSSRKQGDSGGGAFGSSFLGEADMLKMVLESEDEQRGLRRSKGWR